jgi:hypothetical protein
MSLTAEEIRLIVREVMAEERAAHAQERDAAQLTLVSAILTGFGINDDDRKDIREDFAYLRRWRQTSEKIQHGGWIGIMTLLVSGLGAALFLGIKSLLTSKGMQ